MESIQTAILTHHSENMPTLHRKKLILELNPGLSCLRSLRQQSASAPAAHPYKPAQASAFWMFFPPDSRCRKMCQAAATGLVLLWAQAEVNRIAVSACASQRSTQDTLWLLQWLHLFTPGSLHLERERGLAASVWHTHTHSLTHSLFLSCFRFVGLMDMILTSIPTNVVTTASKSKIKCQGDNKTTHFFPSTWMQHTNRCLYY